MTKELWKGWVIDLNVFHTEEMVTFIPVDKDDNCIIGLNYLSNKCPGELIGVIHDNEDYALTWIENHPDWQIKYSKQ